MDTEIGVVIYMYLKHSPVGSKYIWVHGLTPKAQVFLLIYHFRHV